MNLFKKSFVGIFVLLTIIISFFTVNQKVFAYQNTFDIFENATTIRFVSVEENIPDSTHYYTGDSISLTGKISTDNNLFSVGNTNVSMKATMYSVSATGVESIMGSSQFMINSSNLSFAGYNTVNGNTTFSLTSTGSRRIKIVATAFNGDTETRSFDFTVHNGAVMIINMWANPTSVYYYGNSLISWDIYPKNGGISCGINTGNLSGLAHILFHVSILSLPPNNSPTFTSPAFSIWHNLFYHRA